MSKRITITDDEQTALKGLLEDVLNTYYSDASYNEVEFLDFGAESDYLMERLALNSLLKKIT